MVKRRDCLIFNIKRSLQEKTRWGDWDKTSAPVREDFGAQADLKTLTRGDENGAKEVFPARGETEEWREAVPVLQTYFSGAIKHQPLAWEEDGGLVG